MKLLAIETATESCSAALYVDGTILFREKVAPREHASLILGMCDELLVEADLALSQLDAVAFGRGPGSFTGVRIATGVIQGIAFGADLPVAPISSLAALAQGAYRREGTERIVTAIDARMNEVYWGAFLVRDGLVEPVADETVLSPEQVPIPDGSGWFATGTGWQTYRDALMNRLGDRVVGVDAERFPSARDVAALAVRMVKKGETVPAEAALPSYKRNNVATKPQPR